MSRLTATCSLLLASLAACSTGGTPLGPDDHPDAGSPDGGGDEVDAAGPDTARTWPRSAATLRAAMGDRGAWTSAWQLDEDTGVAGDDLGGSALTAVGSLAYHVEGAWAEDRAIGFDSGEDRLVAQVAPFKLPRGRSVAALLSVRLDGDSGGMIAGQHDGTSGAVLLAVDGATGHLRTQLDDGVTRVTATLPIDHRDGRYHDVLIVIDRESGVVRLQSDLGRGAAASIAPLGDLVPTVPFTFGAGPRQPAASASIAYAALATADVGELLEAGDAALHALRLATLRSSPAVRAPEGLPWVPPWPVLREQRGSYTLDVDPHELVLVTDAHLWLSPQGDDANPGTASLPRRSVGAALASMTTSTTLHLLPGVYEGDAGWLGVSPRHDVNIIAEGGRARITAATDGLAWQPSATGAGVYEASLSQDPYAVVDDVAGAGFWMERLAIMEQVAQVPGSWWAGDGRVVVHPLGGRAPDDRLMVMPIARLNAVIDDAERSVYLEGVDLEGGWKALHVRRARRLILVDSSFRLADSEGLSVLSTAEVLVFHGRASANGRDGLSYSYTPRVLEVGCIGRDNGHHQTNFDNGSTVHSGATVVRVGGVYRDNGGPNIADVQGAWSWNLGTVAAGSRSEQSTQRVNFYIDGELWLRESTASDRREDDTVDVFGGPGAHLHVHDSTLHSTGGAATVDDRAE